VKPEIRREVEDLFHQALQRRPEERTAYLEKHCPNNESLRRDVESLLREYGDAGRLYTLYGLARTYTQTNQLQRADPLLVRAVEIGHAIRARTPEMAETLELHSTLLQRLSKSSEAEKFHTEAVRIRAELAWTTRAETLK
jgi:hypothetical protein